MIRDRNGTKTLLSVGARLLSKLDLAVVLQEYVFAMTDLHSTHNAIKSFCTSGTHKSALQQHIVGDLKNEKECLVDELPISDGI